MEVNFNFNLRNWKSLTGYKCSLQATRALTFSHLGSGSEFQFPLEFKGLKCSLQVPCAPSALPLEFLTLTLSHRAQELPSQELSAKSFQWGCDWWSCLMSPREGKSSGPVAPFVALIGTEWCLCGKMITDVAMLWPLAFVTALSCLDKKVTSWWQPLTATEN
jgi:hypothetical protein